MVQRRKYPVSGSCVDEKACWMSEVRGEWADWLEDDRKTTLTQITTRYTKICRIPSLNTQHVETLKQMGYSTRTPHRVPLLSDKNRKRRLQFTQNHQNWTTEDWKMLPDLMSLDFCCIQTLGSEFGVKNMKAWIHPACLNGFRLLVVV